MSMVAVSLSFFIDVKSLILLVGRLVEASRSSRWRDREARVEQPLNDDIGRVCGVEEDFRRKISGSEQVGQNVARIQISRHDCTEAFINSSIAAAMVALS